MTFLVFVHEGRKLLNVVAVEGISGRLNNRKKYLRIKSWRATLHPEVGIGELSLIQLLLDHIDVVGIEQVGRLRPLGPVLRANWKLQRPAPRATLLISKRSGSSQ